MNASIGKYKEVAERAVYAIAWAIMILSFFCVKDVNLAVIPDYGFVPYSNPNITAAFDRNSDIKFSADNVSKAEIEIYNLSGNKVKSMFVTANKGENAVSWDGSDEAGFLAPSGTYLCVIKSSDKSKTVKIGLR